MVTELWIRGLEVQHRMRRRRGPHDPPSPPLCRPLPHLHVEAMASAPLEKIKSLWNSQVMDEEQWAINYIKAKYLSLSKAVAALSSRFKPVVAWVEFTELAWTFVRENYKLQVASLVLFKDMVASSNRWN